MTTGSFSPIIVDDRDGGNSLAKFGPISSGPAVYDLTADPAELSNLLEEARQSGAGAELEAEALRTWAREQLAAFNIPKDIVALKELPRTETGKIQKWKLTDVDGSPEA